MNKKSGRRERAVVAIGKSDCSSVDEFFTRLRRIGYNVGVVGLLRLCRFRILTAKTGSCYSLVAATRSPNNSLSFTAKREKNSDTIVTIDMWNNQNEVDTCAIYFGMLYNGTIIQDIEKTKFYWLTPDEMLMKVLSGEWLPEQINMVREFIDSLSWIQSKVDVWEKNECYE